MCNMSLVLISFLISILAIYSSDGFPTNKIVGGNDTDIIEIPYQVSLQYESIRFHFCGGSIIGPKHILTAGHCIETSNNPTDKIVVVGMTTKSTGGIVHTIKSSVRNPEYGSVHIYSHDVAILELDEPIVFNERAQPVHLPDADEELPVGKVCRIGGWGRLSQDGDSPDHLQSTTLPIWKPEDCATAYEYDESLFVGKEAPLICAGWKGSEPDTCNGDSGGALVCDGTQYGIVSFGMGCANPQYPKVFTHVYNMRQFIRDNTGI